ncbi:flagellar hook-basal body protein [Halalkalibacterium halodurans]|uniref:Flagellar hook-basal body protein n=1 Tax=Halalkalibacterium halodurans (strain ATCC BAA-125 / DSM 18197 / FERM 7344 / JCM 9153 / C-125) TaxID=272558 RepID=Q9K6J2_HALH5|nr:flagellar hook-basal body protein [Halalkalibacterium halodurans]MED4079821.1 flagellar hook-basal body protein [Halalkalibacterium halodurans]MED4083753.1 flagellar hook-basal body protein [Halalkalibacterium halodurans]MED4106558.1 flagellar hook-basal body protein [Halalkalibacterium halodurans]MED4109594.1 flagellar hook-basal body protein [Halalkalibacterium halodurans]MED4123408.1 flagellar hook-basal body protein [Halalkalibacterium halodurans]
MNLSMISASVTMGELQKKLDTLSHNIANSNTTGYKRREASFSDLLFQQVNTNKATQYETGRLTPNGIRVGSGAKVSQTALRMEQGTLTTTDRALDFAIANPSSFFEIETVVDGNPVTRLTRDGAFYLTANPNNDNLLQLVTQNGDYLLDSAGNRINIPATFEEITLTDQGTLQVTMPNGANVQAAQLQLIQVMKPQLLEAVGGNMFQLPDLAALGFAENEVYAAVGAGGGAVVQGTLEGSNVDIGREMTDLIETQRNYQFNARSVSMADQMMGLVNGLRR